MENKIKRFLALALALALTLSCVPAPAFAEETEEIIAFSEDLIEYVEEDPMLSAEEEEEAPAQPTATVSDAEREGAAFAVEFVADAMTPEQQAYYGGWNVDLVLEVNKPLTMNNLQPGEYSYLSIYCPAMGFNWTDMPGGNVEIPANTPWALLAFGGKTVTYAQFAAVGGVGYAAIFQESYLKANPGLEATVSLVLTSPETDETVTVKTYEYESPYEIPKLPGATITDIPANELDPDVSLTFAKTFNANTPDEAQIAYYGDWYADFVLTVNTDVTLNAEDETSDGYLAGEYGEWGWVKAPVEAVTLKKGESLKIMEYAAELMGESGLQITYAEVLESVQNFNCGAYFTPEFLEENPELEVRLELRLYETATDKTGKRIGETFIFTAADAAAPALPGATVVDTLQTELDEGMTLTFAKTFTAEEPSAEQAEYYGKYYADFVLKVNKDVTLNADSETADGWLSGQYDEWSKNWVNVPIADVTLKAGEELRIMEYAAEVLNQPGLKMTYKEIVEIVQNFNCGAYFTDEFLTANPDFEATLELRLYNPKDETKPYVIGETYKFTAYEVPELPKATVNDVVNKEMTFAKNFSADEITAAQMAYYGDWYADFELTVNQEVTFDANGSADGWLSGQYDAWSENWVNVPLEPVTLKKNETLKIMEYAAELMGEPGLKYTYREVFDVVKDFSCGVFFDPDFLLNLDEDLVVTLELRMYDPADESKSYAISDTYEYKVPVAPELPTATVSDAANEELTFAKNFKADEISAAQLAYYGNWYADFELTVNKDVTLDANGSADGWLSGQYDAWSENWVNVPLEPVTLKAGETLKIMEYAAELMGEPGLKYTYKEVYEVVKDFDCGVFFAPAFLLANPDLEVRLELKMYNPFDETVSYAIGETYIFTNDFEAYNVQKNKLYAKVGDAVLEAAAEETVQLLRDAETGLLPILESTDLDLNGHKLTADYVTCYGNIIDSSEANSGVLAVPSSRFLIRPAHGCNDYC